MNRVFPSAVQDCLLLCAQAGLPALGRQHPSAAVRGPRNCLVWEAPEGGLRDTRAGGGVRPVEFGFLEELNTAKQRPLASFEPGRRGRGQLGATPVRSTGLKTTLGVPGWLSLMVGRSLKGGDRWKAVKTSTFKIKIKAGTIFSPCSSLAGVGRRNITSLAPLHLFWFCLFIYLSSRSVLPALPSGAVWCPQRGKKTCARFSALLNVEGKCPLPDFPRTIPSFLWTW